MSESLNGTGISWYEQNEPCFFEESSFAPALQRVRQPEKQLDENIYQAERLKPGIYLLKADATEPEPTQPYEKAPVYSGTPCNGGASEGGTGPRSQ